MAVPEQIYPFFVLRFMLCPVLLAVLWLEINLTLSALRARCAGRIDMFSKNAV